MRDGGRRLLAIVAAVLLTAVPATLVYAQSAGELSRQLSELRERVSDLRERIADIPVQTSERRETIADLQATLDEVASTLDGVADDIAVLEARESVVVCPYTWDRTLSRGSQGPDVKRLQLFLNERGFRVARSGPGSPGSETDYYGPATQRAVTTFQETYAQDILTARGLARGTGIFDAPTRAKANALCTDTADAQDPAKPEQRPAGNEGELGFALRGGGGTLSETEERDVLRFDLSADDAPIRLRNVQVLFQAQGDVRDDEPWTYIRRAELLFDREVVASVDASNESAWREAGDDANPVYRLRFSGLSSIIPEGESEGLRVRVQAASFIDSSDVPQDFAVSIGERVGDDDGVLATDAAGIRKEAGAWGDTRMITFEKD
jgi:hypothetical protein